MMQKRIRIKPKALIVLSLLLIIIIGITSGIIFINSKKLKIDYKKEIKVSINDKIYNTDAIKKIKNGKVITKKELVDTSKLGEKTIKFEIQNYFKKIISYKYIIIVYDEEKPKIEYQNKFETEEGKEIDLLKDVVVIDNSKETITAEVEGDFDFNTPGEYKLYFTAKDSSGNETKEEFTLIVNKRKVIEEPKKATNPRSGSSDSNTTTTSKGYTLTDKNGITYVDGYMIINKTYSLPKTYAPGLTSDAKNNFNNMKEAAREDDIDLYISSGYRSYSTQNTLYNRYVSQDGKTAADTYSARPGHSEHQSGLAIDLNIIDDSFANTKEAKWLAENCYKYGFILRYPKGKSNETGYKYEPWHFRYVGKDLAEKLYNDGNWITMESYFGITSEYK